MVQWIYHLGPGYHPEDEDEDGKECSAKEIGDTEAQSRSIPEEFGQVGRLEARDVLDIALACLWVRVRLVLADDIRKRPAAQFSDDRDHASCSMLRSALATIRAYKREQQARTLPWLQ